jgi:hypothetical protein
MGDIDLGDDGIVADDDRWGRAAAHDRRDALTLGLNDGGRRGLLPEELEEAALLLWLLAILLGERIRPAGQEQEAGSRQKHEEGAQTHRALDPAPMTGMPVI